MIFDLPTIVTIIGILSTVIGSTVAIMRKFNKLETRVASLESKIEPFWNLVKQNLGKLLTTNPSGRVLNILEKGDKITIEEITFAKKHIKKQFENGPESKRTNLIFVLWYLEFMEKEIK